MSLCSQLPRTSHRTGRCSQAVHPIRHARCARCVLPQRSSSRTDRCTFPTTSSPCCSAFLPLSELCQSGPPTEEEASSYLLVSRVRRVLGIIVRYHCCLLSRRVCATQDPAVEAYLVPRRSNVNTSPLPCGSPQVCENGGVLSSKCGRRRNVRCAAAPVHDMPSQARVATISSVSPCPAPALQLPPRRAAGLRDRTSWHWGRPAFADTLCPPGPPRNASVTHALRHVWASDVQPRE
ncbi:hypothetical protein K466DRAFT_1597 [Polyporus arcularius HHB13444]|uniref:Uncharacterized protein n=1 Tax=Polyporus arcularius HHB13444 TaxID=1314778 RepID=A0A5C3Q1Q3_9APHY|nr:hypothetical protein K466DRAFT_1597 [Polyporus arcularius HHB13444]